MKAKDITLIGMMIAVIEVCKVVMAGIPNVELTSFWIIVFCACFGKKIIRRGGIRKWTMRIIGFRLCK